MGDCAACRLVDHNRACPGEDESERPDEFCRKALHTLSATQCSSQNESILPRISSRALGFKEFATALIQQFRRHLAASTVMNANEQNFLFSHLSSLRLHRA